MDAARARTRVRACERACVARERTLVHVHAL